MRDGYEQSVREGCVQASFRIRIGLGLSGAVFYGSLLPSWLAAAVPLHLGARLLPASSQTVVVCHSISPGVRYWSWSGNQACWALGDQQSVIRTWRLPRRSLDRRKPCPTVGCSAATASIVCRWFPVSMSDTILSGVAVEPCRRVPSRCNHDSPPVCTVAMTVESR